MSKILEYYLGVDIGGTNLKAILLDDDKKEIEKYTLATPKDNVEHFFIMLKALIDPLIKIAQKNKAKIKGIGVGIPGIYNYKTKKIIELPNLSLLNNINICSRMEKEFELPIKIDNDGNCFTLAEALIGSCQKYKNVLGITLGTGIGSGWFFNKKTYNGANGCVTELARMIIEKENGDLENVYQKIITSNAEELAKNAYRGDKNAQESFEEIGYYLGIALANVINLIDPEVIVIGGKVANSNDLFFPKIKKTIEELAMHPEAKKIKVIRSKMKEEVGAKGAALLWN